VRWGCFQLAIDRLEHRSQILRHIIIPKTDNAITVTGDLKTTLLVSGLLIGMLAPIEFDDEFLFRAGEIGNAIADRMLSTKFVERQALAECTPQNLFGVS
jgi:hypothetical protein